jgi:hypothetical protein
MKGSAMIRRSILFAACLLASQPSFADPVPVPADKAAYVGEWLGKACASKSSRTAR